MDVRVGVGSLCFAAAQLHSVASAELFAAQLSAGLAVMAAWTDSVVAAETFSL